ncbi:MAG: tetratricopeptide repeat protein, partial [Chlamydiia bacterium]|nr:tetratricopeptide repeat protein [Chlamydiia bacterium]
MQSMAEYHWVLGENGEAEHYLRQNLERLETSAPKSEEYALACHNYALFLVDQKAWDEASALMERADRLLDPESEVWTTNAAALARAYAQLGRLEEADSLAKRALRAAKSLSSPIHSCELQYFLGLLRLEEGAGEEAERHFASALRHLQKFEHPLAKEAELQQLQARALVMLAKEDEARDILAKQL